jgi:SAM-dependent methyltransferase
MTFFQDSYVEGNAPWDTGRPQVEVVALAEAGEIVGSVLDIGCGTGENSIYLAGRGHAVVGIDLAPRAIELSKEKSKARGVPAEFLVRDVTKSLDFDTGFDTAIDAAVFHVFDDEGKRAYIRSLAGVVRPGGRFHVIVWSEHEHGEGGPARSTQAELRGFFADGWDDIRIRAGRYETAFNPDGARAWVASMKRAFSDND